MGGKTKLLCYLHRLKIAATSCRTCAIAAVSGSDLMAGSHFTKKIETANFKGKKFSPRPGLEPGSPALRAGTFFKQLPRRIVDSSKNVSNYLVPYNS